MKKAWAIGLAVFLWSGIVCAAPPDLATRLNVPQDRIRFDQADLSDALAITAETVHANLVVDWSALLYLGVHQDTHVSMEFDNGSAATTFDVICRLVGHGIVWQVQDDAIHVTTQDELNKQGLVRTYWTNAIGGPLEERAAKAANILRDYVPGLGDSSVRIGNGQLIVRAAPDIQQTVTRVMALCSRPMLQTEWRELLGVEEDLNNSTDRLSVSWQGTAISKCVAELSDKTKIPMVLASAADPEFSVNINLKNAAPREILTALLAAGSGGDNNNNNDKNNGWTCEPIAHGKVLWIGPASRASNFCASFVLGPAAMRELRINSVQDGPGAICAMVPGCDSDHVRWIDGLHILCLQKMDKILAIGKLLADPSFITAMRPQAHETSAAGR
ncbi:MAG TPA: hypothetical protein VGG19_18500 [Tepidisphaeraceae bacterium]